MRILIVNDIRVARSISVLLEQALEHLETANELINDTGDVESEELDQISTSISHAQTKLQYYLGGL